MKEILSHHWKPLIPLSLFLGFIWYWIYSGFYWNESGGISTFLWTLNSDWMMHISQVQAFSEFSLLHVITHNPLYSGEVLTYPFFVNWISGVLFSMSDNLVFSMTLPLYVGSVLFVGGIYFLGYTLTQSRFISIFSVFLFFFLAGFHGIDILGEYTSNQWRTLADYSLNVEFLEIQGYLWKSFFLTTFLPQRSYLWGMAIGTILFGIFIKYFLKNIKIPSSQNFAGSESVASAEEKYMSSTSIGDLGSSDIRYFNISYFTLGLAIGCLSFIHTHTFFYFFFLFLGLMLWYWKSFFSFVSLGIGTLISSTPFLYILSQKSGESIFESFKTFPLSVRGYEQFFSTSDFLPEILQNIFHIFVYWFWNWGAFFLFMLMVLYKPFFSLLTDELNIDEIQKQFLFRLLWINTIIFFLFSVLQTQDNPWDNTKLHLWSALFCSFGVGLILKYCWYKKIIGKIISVLIFISLTFSGILLVISGINDEKLSVFSQQEIQYSEDIKQIIPSDSLVLTSDYFHHWFPPLLPNQIFMGYRGWMGSYGLDYSQKVRIATSIYTGDKNALYFIQNEKIEYILVDSSISHAYGVRANINFFQTHFTKIYTKNDVSLWKTTYNPHNDG